MLRKSYLLNSWSMERQSLLKFTVTLSRKSEELSRAIVVCWHLVLCLRMTTHALTVRSKYKTFCTNSNGAFLNNCLRARIWLLPICSLTRKSGLGHNTWLTIRILKMRWQVGWNVRRASFMQKGFQNCINAMKNASTYMAITWKNREKLFFQM